jgi:hypothetical protein
MQKEQDAHLPPYVTKKTSISNRDILHLLNTIIHSTISCFTLFFFPLAYISKTTLQDPTDLLSTPMREMDVTIKNHDTYIVLAVVLYTTKKQDSIVRTISVCYEARPIRMVCLCFFSTNQSLHTHSLLQPPNPTSSAIRLLFSFFKIGHTILIAFEIHTGAETDSSQFIKYLVHNLKQEEVFYNFLTVVKTCLIGVVLYI